MSFVFVNNSSETFTPTESGAIATFIWECCRVARETGVQPWVVTRAASATAYEHQQTIFVDYPSVPTSRLGTLLCRTERKLNGWRHLRQKAYALRVAETLAQRDLAQHPLMLHNDPEMAVLLRSRFPRATIIHHFHNHLECKPKFRALVGRSNLVLSAVSKFTAAWVQKYYELPAGSVQAIYNGVDSRHFSPAAPPRNGKCFLNFVGRTGREKAPDLLLAAAQNLASRTRDFGVQIVGSNHWNRFERDEYQQQLESLTHDLETRGVEVRRLGHVQRSQLPQAIREAHVHVVPSRWDEPFGLTTLEGMACGLATVGSRTGGTPEIIGESGFLFERDSAAGLADQLEPLVRDADLRHDYAHRARQRAMEFSWDRTWQGLKKVAAVEMHIAILNLAVEYYSPICGGAIATVVMETARQLIALGHEVSVLTITNHDPVYPVGRVVPLQARNRDSLSFFQRRVSGVRQRFGQWDWPYYEYFMKSYTEALRQLKPDVVVVHNDLAAPRFIKQTLPNVPVIAWLHNENRTSQRNLEANQRAVNHYVTVSQYIRHWTMTSHQVEPERITAVLNGVNLEMFFPREILPAQAGATRVLFASRIDYNKGPDLAADAVGALRAEGLPVSLTVAGGLWWYKRGNEMHDPYFIDLRDKMQSAGAEYLGHVTRDQIPELFRTHDIVCLLSRSQDPAPLVCLEAMASGCVLLASPRGGIPELCQRAAVLVNPDDLRAVTDALRPLVQERDYRNKMRQAGLARAAQRPWSKVVEEFQVVLEKVVPSKRRAVLTAAGV